MYTAYTAITAPTQLNLTHSKIIVVHDDLISFENNPLTIQTYNFNPFSQFEEAYHDLIT